MNEAIATYLEQWANKYATHNNDNPNCYSGSCKCETRMIEAAVDLLKTVEKWR